MAQSFLPVLNEVEKASLDERQPLPARYRGLSDEEMDRRITAARATLGRRGSASAVCTVLSALTRGPVDVDDDGGVYREGSAPASSGTVRVRATSLGHLREQELVDLVLMMVPANLAVVVECAGTVLYPPEVMS